MMVFWIGLAIAIVAIAWLLWQRQSNPSAANEQPRMAPTLFTLRVGDIVQHLDVDWVVEGQLIYTEGAYTWFEYLLQEGDRLAWLSVEEDDTIEVALQFPAKDVDIALPPPSSITFGGTTYQQTESGQAQMRRVGTTGIRQAEQCRYYDYEGDGKSVLSVEDWDGDIEVTVGESVMPLSLTLLPGDGRSVYRG